jgi:hypothetical protein
MNYYVQKYLLYLANKTDNEAIIDFVNQVIDSTGRQGVTYEPHPSPLYAPNILRKFFDVGHSFIDRQEIVIPGFTQFVENDGRIVIPYPRSPIINIGQPSIGDPITIYTKDHRVVDELEIPFDGVHLEVAAGGCILQNIPPPEPIPTPPAIVVKCNCECPKDETVKSEDN